MEAYNPCIQEMETDKTRKQTDWPDYTNQWSLIAWRATKENTRYQSVLYTPEHTHAPAHIQTIIKVQYTQKYTRQIKKEKVK